MASKTSTKPVGIQCEPVLGVRNVYKFSKKGSTTEAYVIDRESLSKSIPIKELQYPGIYFLIGDALDGSDIRNVYVGKAGLHNSKNKDENQAILGRLRQHDTSKTESYRDLWNFAVAITQYSVEKTSGSTAELYGSWGLTEVSNLENIFYHNLPSNCKLNSAEPNLGSDFHDNTDYSGLVAQIKELLVASGSIDFEEGVNLQETGVYDAETPVEQTNVKNEGQSEHAKTTVKESAVTTNINPLASVPEYTTPKKTVRQVEDCINPELLNPHTTFIDLACKGGEFLKELYNRLMQAESLIAEFPNEFARSAHILSNQLYGVALSNVSADKARRNLLGYGKNIVTIPNYIGILKDSYGTAARKAKQLGLIYEHTDIKDVLKGLFKTESGDPVKFDVVIGNPPYQESTSAGNNGGKAIYDSFVMLGMDIADDVCMIIKNNWMNSDTLGSLRTKMLDFGMSKLINYPVLGEVFPGNGIAASIICLSKGYRGNTEYSEVADGKVVGTYSEKLCNSKKFIPTSSYELSIASKVADDTDKFFDERFVGLSPFGINTNGAVGRDSYIDEQSSRDAEFDTEIMYSRYRAFVRREDVPKNSDLIDMYKIACPKQVHKTSNPIPEVIPLGPGKICSASYSIMYCCNDPYEGTAVYKYINTRFFRFLVYCLSDTLCGLGSYRVSIVPLQDFTDKSDINWQQSVDEVDEQLFKKYKLSDDEVAYIKKTIKPTV